MTTDMEESYERLKRLRESQLETFEAECRILEEAANACENERAAVEHDCCRWVTMRCAGNVRALKPRNPTICPQCEAKVLTFPFGKWQRKVQINALPDPNGEANTALRVSLSGSAVLEKFEGHITNALDIWVVPHVCPEREL